MQSDSHLLPDTLPTALRGPVYSVISEIFMLYIFKKMQKHSSGKEEQRNSNLRYLNITGWVVTWFLLGYTVRKNGGLLSTPMF